MRSRTPSSGTSARSCHREDGANSRGASEQVLPLPPKGTVLQLVTQLVVQLLECTLKVRHMGTDISLRSRTSSVKSILLRCYHRHDLSPAGQQVGDNLGFGIRQFVLGGLNCLTKVGKHLGVQNVGLSQPTNGPGELPPLAGDSPPLLPDQLRPAQRWRLLAVLP